MRLPTMRQLERAGLDAGKLLDRYMDYLQQFPATPAIRRRIRAIRKRRREFFS